MLQPPNPPWYRRWSVLLAAVILLAAATAWLGWRGLQQVATPQTTGTTRPLPTIPQPTVAKPPTIREATTTKPDPAILWERRGSDVHRSEPFLASNAWRILWSFDCSDFSAYGGNFKLTGEGAFEDVLIQRFDVKASGSRSVTSTGLGRLVIDSVCERWTVKAVAG